MPEQSCPHCGGETVAEASCCRHCSRRIIGFKDCPTCREPISDKAAYCPYCSQKVPTKVDLAARELNLKVRATHLGACLTGGWITGLLFPPIINVADGRIKITKWGLLGLRTHHQEIQVNRVASVRYTKGVIWGGIVIETFGGKAEDLAESGLRQEDARNMAAQIKSVLADKL